MNRQQRRAAAKSAKTAPRPLAAAPDALVRLGLAHLQSGQVDEAERCCRQALTLQPDLADALHLMGLVAISRKQHDHALEWISGALRQEPKPEYLFSIGNALQAAGRLDEALKAYDRAVSLKPDEAEIWNGMGVVLARLKRTEQAIAAFQHALKLNPRHVLAAHMCATELFEAKRFDEAAPYYDLCVELEPDRAYVYRGRGLCHSHRSMFEQAIVDYEKALKMDPDHADTYYNLGGAHLKLGQHDQASRAFERVLTLDPDRVEALNCKGLIAVERRQFAEAFAAYERALDIEPCCAAVQWNLALLNLRMGDFKSGWAGYEWRWKVPDLRTLKRNFERPLWLGAEPIAGKKVLLHNDQGFGDALQFCRYVPLVAALGAQVILEVPEPLRELFSGIRGVSQVLAMGQALPHFDYHCPLGSLPLAFKTTLETIPSASPYIPIGSRAERWKDRLATLKGPRIGLAWSGNPNNAVDRGRSIPLESLLPLLDVGAQFVSLQKDVRPADRAVLDQRTDILDLGSEIENFADTAAIISQLDLVISVDTSVSHLAGALGRPLWILLQYVPCWRYLLDRTDSPWYPTARLFRQSEAGEWRTVVYEVRAELRSFISSLRSANEIVGAKEAEAANVAKLTSSASAATPDTILRLGLAHLQSGQVDEAERCCRQALTLQPEFADALHLMGLVAISRKQHDHALEWIAGALRQEPKPEYLFSIGNALQAVGRLDEALKAYDRAVSLKPDEAEIWNGMGLVLIRLGRTEEAILTLQHVLKLNPGHALAARMCATLLFKADRFDEAIPYYDLCVELEADGADAYRSRGICQSRRSRFDLALADFEMALTLDPNHADTHYNLGHTHLMLGQYEAASRCFDRALGLKPDQVSFLRNKANAAIARREFSEAFAAFERALTLEPDNADVQWNLALLDLRAGDFKTGWARYEWRWKVPELPLVKLNVDAPLWLGGEPISGKTVLLYSDQGLGDALQFCRYVPLLVAKGARVILAVQETLRELLSGMGGISSVVAFGEQLPDFDYYCPLCSLPLAFGTTLETIPSGLPYLRASSRVERWKSRLASLKSPRIGLAWSGNPNNGLDRDRSIPLQALLPLLDMEARFVSLQKDVRPADRAVLDQRNDILDLGPELENFADTAAVISQLDLVISVDTSVSHLAGALGHPLWILLQYMPCWRYLLDRTDSPWYPTARLFRQSEAREWGSVVRQVRAELSSLIRAKPS